MSLGMLTFFCGKMGAGKTTRANELAETGTAVLLSEDKWLQSLYPNKVTSVESYVKYSNLLKPLVKELVQSMLTTGTDVVLDFPANTIEQRSWIRSIYSQISASHKLVYIDAADSVCLRHIAQRRLEQPERAATDTEEMFRQITRYFVEPTDAEDFNVTKVEITNAENNDG